jgi:hypothetical protein
MTTWSAIREMEDQLHTAKCVLMDEIDRKTELLDDACWALDYCFHALQQLGHKWDDTNSGVLSDELREWLQKESAKTEAQEQKYKAAMAEKRGRALRKHWPANVVPLREG